MGTQIGTNQIKDEAVTAAKLAADVAAAYAPAAKGVTNGDSHDHAGGDGAQVDHANLLNKGTNAHATIDAHLTAASPHSGHALTIHDQAAKATPVDADELAVSDSAAGWAQKASTWANIKATLKTYFDTLYAVAAKGVTNGDSHDHSGGDGAQISHTALSNVGSNTHAQLDTAATNSANHIAGQPFAGHAANPACRVYHSASQSIGANSWLTVAFNSERFDTDAIHDTGSNTSRLTCKTAGKYEIFAHARMEYTGPTYTLALVLNGATYIAYDEGRYIGDHIGLMVGTVSTVYDLAVNDYVELRIFNGDGGTSRSLYTNGNYSPEFGMVRVG